MASLSENLTVDEARNAAEEQNVAQKSVSQDEKQASAGCSENSCSTSTSRELPSNNPSQGQPSNTARTDAGVPPFDSMWYPWTSDASALRPYPEFMPLNGGQLDQAGLCHPMVPIMCPAPFPGLLQAPSQEEQQLRSGGIFAVPLVPIIGPVAVFPPGGLIPFSYSFPQSTPVSVNASMQGTVPAAPMHFDSERVLPAEVQEGAGAGLRNRPPPPAQVGQVQRPEGQRQIVRRFHVAFQLDLLLILKLAVVVFVFNQDGSRDRLLLLLLLAGLVYLYQTGALTPFLQWISRSAQQAMMPPQQPQLGRVPPAGPVVQARDVGGNVQDENVAANAPVADVAVAPDQDGVAAPVGGGGDGEAAGAEAPQQAAQRPTWWGLFKELQMLVVGFVTSLLPGFQHVD